MLIIQLTAELRAAKPCARIFRDLGAHLIDADRIVHKSWSRDGDMQRDCASFRRDSKSGFFSIEGSLEISYSMIRKSGSGSTAASIRKVFEAYTAQVRNIRRRQPDIIF
jgi:hypothetical protein